MLAATVFTTFLSGLAMAEPSGSSVRYVADAMTFPAALLSILLAHELGHFLACRRYGLDATLPLFIPGPPFPLAIGTFGAFIRIRSRIRERAKLFDVGAAGPLAGFVLAVAWTIVGLRLSHIIELPSKGSPLEFGESALFWALRRLIVGEPPTGQDVVLHPIAMAGWLGLFVTSLNLLAAGQLDGGHIAHAMFGRAHRVISRVVFVGLVWWGVLGDPVAETWWQWAGAGALLIWSLVLSLRPPGRKLALNVFLGLVLLQIVAQINSETSSASGVWLVWGLLVYLFGLDHPPATDLHTPLSPARRAVGVVCLAVFLGTFIPLPIKALVN
jgi:membrane-associated protease RseP (regulator of RpoE activity)